METKTYTAVFATVTHDRLTRVAKLTLRASSSREAYDLATEQARAASSLDESTRLIAVIDGNAQLWWPEGVLDLDAGDQEA